MNPEVTHCGSTPFHFTALMQLKKGTSANNIRYFWIQIYGSTLFWSLILTLSGGKNAEQIAKLFFINVLNEDWVYFHKGNDCQSMPVEGQAFPIKKAIDVCMNSGFKIDFIL